MEGQIKNEDNSISGRIVENGEKIEARVLSNSTPISGQIVRSDNVVKANPSMYGGATETQKGVIRIATIDEVLEGESRDTAVTPRTLKLSTAETLEEMEEQIEIALKSRANGMLYNPETKTLYLTCDGEVISEGTDISNGEWQKMVTLTNLLPSDTLWVAKGLPAVISYMYEDLQNLDGTVQYIVNNVVKYTGRIKAGDTIDFDLAEYLDDGYNYVQVQVTDLINSSNTLIYEVNTIALTISSTFDSSMAYTEPINFRYTPVGEVTKTIHFEIDGVEEVEQTDVSGRPLTKILTLSHGVHVLRVWESAVIGLNTVTSNVLKYEVIYVAGTETLISSEFEPRTYVQGETVNIPLIVYNPLALTTDLDVYIDNELVSSMNVGRTKFTYGRAIDKIGNVTISFVAGGTRRDFELVFEESQMDVEPVTENLQLFLTGTGRNNHDADREIWEYGNIHCTLSGFNFVNNGWIDNALKISGGATVEIPLKIFAEDFRVNGKTIEIEFSTSNVLDYNTIVASCMSGNRGFQISVQNSVFRSEQSEVKTKFKEDEHIRLSFVIEPRSSNRLIYTYLNGIISGITQYPEDDDFSQITPVNITLGNIGCDLSVYNIRVYDAALTHYDMLNNYIADTADVSKKLSLYTANNIYDNYGNIVYSKLINQIPIMTITGALPSVKGDKKKVKVAYENQADITRNFEMEGVTLDIQGTSSQYYPKKNYKISKMPKAYSLRQNSPAEKVFTMKADYMESSHAHNTGLAKYINGLYTDLTPPQQSNPVIRTTIDGFPIAMFYKKNDTATPLYFGVYNFNNDKSSDNTFGFTEGCESWEFSNNTSPRCLFLTDDFSSGVLDDFEARYPSDYTDYSKLQALITWVYHCYRDRATNGIERFRAECEQHFNMNYLLTYCIISELFGMVDSRAKNMFLNLYTDNRWYPVFYDLDTAIGLNNEGVNEFNFDIEAHDTIGTENVFNGANSGLWYLVEHAFQDELNELYNEMRNNGKLSYQEAIKWLDVEQISKICEAQYNEDAQVKYVSPLVDDGIATYLYTAQGSRVNHIKWWLYNRFNYMDSKYTASEFKSNYLTMRLYTPAQWQEVEPNASITVVPYADQYVRIKYGSYDIQERAKSGVPTTIVPPAITFNDTETILYGASRINSIGDLAPLYAGTIDVSAAVKLTELKIGHGGNYRNTNLRNLTLGNNTLLQSLDIRNCPNLSGALDISGCTDIKVVKATGTALTSVKLGSAGAITDLLLPDTITNLTVKNQNNIENFTCGNNISTLILENTNLNALELFLNNPVTKVRIVGIDWTLDSFDLLDTIYNMLGSDENGNNLPHGVLGGIVRMSNVRESEVQEYQKKFIGVEFIISGYLEEDYICTDFGEVITTNDGAALLYS